jgi:tetratricopeptide (TPR) repeat protein
VTVENTTRSTAGSIITFYSFKGGTGRSMALANVAWILASSGRRVLVIDWDLESPGLHRYFHPFLIDKTLKSSPGVLDLVRDFASATLEPATGRREPDWFTPRANILPYASSLDWPFPRKGSIDFVPAGRQTASYAQAVSTFEWDSFYDRLGGGALLDALREDMRGQYDYILIDSRTGLSDTAGICTVILPDVVVDCFTLSSQSIDGAAAVAQSILNQRSGRPMRIVPVLMRTEASEKGKLDAGREIAQKRFAAVLGQVGTAQEPTFWVGAEVPYVPFYAFEEILAPFGDPPGQATSLLAAFERLTATLTDGRVTQLHPMDEQVRRQRLAEFERARRVRLPDVVLSYSSHDRLWAEWLRAELATAGYKVTSSCVELTVREPAASPASGALPETALALLSQEYMAAPQSAFLWESMRSRHRSGRDGLVTLQLEGASPSPPFDRPTAVDLTGVSEPEARSRILAALGQSAPPEEVPDRDPRWRGTARFPGAIPRVVTMPSRNDLFTGRAELLEDLRDRLGGSGSKVQPQFLYGLGGVGKTQIAIEYAHRFAADYDVVWWMSAEQPGLVRAALARLARAIDLPSGGDQAADIDAVLTAMRATESGRRWLLVFDNAEDPAELTGLLPAHGHVHVLITSRTPGPSPSTSIEVPVFSREHSITLLLRRAEGVAPGEADAVAERLGDLPLAIEHAGAWLAATGMTATAYLDLLDTRMSDVLSQQQSPDYPHPVAATWLISLDRLRDQKPAAARLMELCACFASEPIPTRLLLKEPVTSLLAEYDPDLRDPMLLAQLFQEVLRYSLVRVDSSQGTLEVHRLVQVVIREQMEPELRARTERSVLDILVAANPGDTDTPRNWPLYAEIWPHVSVRALASEAREVRLLILDMIRYLWKSGDLSTARGLADQAIERWTPVFGPDDATTLRAWDELSNTLHVLGEFEDALHASETAAGRLTRTLGQRHPYSLIALNSLAGRLLAGGQYQRSRALSLEILPPTEDVFGKGHQRTMFALNQVITSARFTGDLREAARLNEQLYEQRRERQPNHPDTLGTAAMLGRDYRDLGDFTKSRTRLESAVQDLIEILGKDHQETIKARSSFAVTWRKLGEFNNAHSTSTAALDRALRTLRRPSHPTCQAISLNLACDDAALGRFENAITRTTEVLEQYLDGFDEDHYLPLIARNNLAVFTRLAGRRSDALNLSSISWEGLAQVFGEEHPSTLAARVNHANDLFATGDIAGARDLDERTYDLLGSSLGHNHPDTLACGNNLALDWRATGNTDSTDTLQERVIRQLIAKLGERHPNCQLAREGKRLNCDIEQPLI